jgi:hypothetical protein
VLPRHPPEADDIVEHPGQQSSASGAGSLSRR